jgi:hypothetical protein
MESDARESELWKMVQCGKAVRNPQIAMHEQFSVLSQSNPQKSLILSQSNPQKSLILSQSNP